MLLNVEFSRVVTVFVLLFLNVQNLPRVSNDQKWAKHLIKDIKTDIKVTQTVLIIIQDAKVQA